MNGAQSTVASVLPCRWLLAQAWTELTELTELTPMEVMRGYYSFAQEAGGFVGGVRLRGGLQAWDRTRRPDLDLDLEASEASEANRGGLGSWRLRRPLGGLESGSWKLEASEASEAGPRLEPGPAAAQRAVEAALGLVRSRGKRDEQNSRASSVIRCLDNAIFNHIMFNIQRRIEMNYFWTKIIVVILRTG